MENETTFPTNGHDETEAHQQSEASLSVSVRQYVNSMYDEFKRSFDQRHMARIDKILKNITNVDPNSNILNIIYGAMALINGKPIESYSHLFKYAQNSSSVDLWALNIMAMWNQLAGDCELALKQFGRVMEGEFANRFLVSVMIFAAKTKKRLGFLDRALDYLERLLSTFDGFRMCAIIKLEIIHIYILKKKYDLAMAEIEEYCEHLGINYFIKRLRVYIHYLRGSHKEILKYKKDEEFDPYISYILAREGLENPKIFNIDIPLYLDEAIKGDKENKYIYNTYGNYYYSTHRFSDAAEQYNNALSLDPKFQASNRKPWIVRKG
ncbi:uncharacterized protein VICG_00915 [Vittaforma corneae ATCC 50505]|uniref:Uncharacterized protein n=1 Tax=Vittaforma corneae (strain ATCC 50505) TaxID=993615 RepID=L2GMK2_VITCO|nr:uncharacterized protein VICG_00915 [Vittaforma corneae ATCC 50505]ELA42066.1 hypothetical protein VICG_00915 [Vittaforma corneae ATCC 50505]